MVPMCAEYLGKPHPEGMQSGSLMESRLFTVTAPIGNSTIYIGTIDGKKEERVAIGYTPTLSPDGRQNRLSHWSFEPTQTHHCAEPKNQGKQGFLPFPKIPIWVRHPAWSPEGDRLAFAWYNRVEFRRDDAHIETIYILNRGSMETQQIVGEAGGAAVNPVWSPRGDELLYEQHDANRSLQIFKIALNGGPTSTTH